MINNFEESLRLVLLHEGGFVHHPKDPGGITNLGVTKRVWEDWLGRPVNEKEMRALTPELVAPLYRKNYWDRVKGDNLPDGLDYCVFDFAVNSGARRAVITLQRVLGVAEDGLIGPVTLGKIQKSNVRNSIKLYGQLRMSFLKSLKTWNTFGKGWSNRVTSVILTSQKMTETNVA